MAKVKIEGNASGTGTFTIAAPNSNTDRTLTLPDEAGTVLTSASDLPAANLTGDVAAARITGALNASGSAPVYACRAWVNFNGTGTVAIRGSGNVSSITDNGAGDYTVNFTTAMPDANYCLVCSSKAATSSARAGGFVGAIDLSADFGASTAAQYTTTSIRIGTTYASNSTSNGGRADIDAVDVAIFR